MLEEVCNEAFEELLVSNAGTCVRWQFTLDSLRGEWRDGQIKQRKFRAQFISS